MVTPRFSSSPNLDRWAKPAALPDGVGLSAGTFRIRGTTLSVSNPLRKTYPKPDYRYSLSPQLLEVRSQGWSILQSVQIVYFHGE